MGLSNSQLIARVIENSLPTGLPEDQARQALDSFLRYQKIGICLSPLGIALKWLFMAALLFLPCVILDIRVSFRNLFALIAQCSFITFLQELTIFLIISLRGDSVETVSDLSPKIGLDLLITNLGKPLMLILNYFSVFNICYILVLTIGLSIIGKCSKPRAFVAAIPSWLLPLIIGLGTLLFNETRV